LISDENLLYKVFQDPSTLTKLLAPAELNRYNPKYDFKAQFSQTIRSGNGFAGFQPAQIPLAGL
jgi:hypothetical protein